MAVTLTRGGTTVGLSDRLQWTDEFSWSPVQQQTAWSLTGALLVDVGVKQAGRPITLEGSETAAWIDRALCTTLRGWSALPGEELVLVLRGQSWPVIFDHARGGFDARPVWKLLDGEETPQQIFIPTFRFLTV